MKQLITILLSFITFISNSQSTIFDESYLKSQWEKNGADEIEGIYIRSRKFENCNGFGNCKTDKFVKRNFFICQAKLEDGTKIFLLGSLDDNKIVGLIEKVNGSNKFFLQARNYWAEDGMKSYEMYLSNSNELILEDIIYNESEESYGLTINRRATISDKFSPIFKPKKVEKEDKRQKSSGTGFGISSNGIIVTNYHVIDNATSIKVRGVNSNFNKTYRAKVLVSDKNNDLALIQIDDYNFTSLAPIPYTIKTSLAGVGENIFVLGYPLRATMGDEIKLTNGIISSKSGFQGEINSYQISAPIQPGNSGGPLFDNQGNLIGIINAKHVGAENASYAIKASYLTNLIDLLPTPPKLQTINSLKGKTLTQQVGQVKNFVFIIETE
jgi:S1-C subfamily serine protease